MGPRVARVIEMSRNIYVVLCILAVTVGIVVVDVLFLRHHFWARLIVNIGIVAVVATIYFTFLKNR